MTPSVHQSHNDRTLFWGKAKPKIGNQVQQTNVQAQNGLAQLLRAEAEDHETEVVTLTLSTDQRRLTPALATADKRLLNGPGTQTTQDTAYALIEWGTAGGTHVAEVDFVNGVALNLAASFINVQVRRSLWDNSGAMNFAATISRGAVSGRSIRPQRTITLGPVPHGDHVPCIVPAFAKTVRFGFSQALAAHLDFSCPSMVRYTKAVAVGLGITDELPISGNIVSINVNNDDVAVDITAVDAIFELDL